MITDARIRAGYDQMWAVGKSDLLNGAVDVDSVPSVPSQRWGISAILRLPTYLEEPLEELVAHLQTYTGDGHTFHNRTSFHITLRSIEGFRADVTQTDFLAARYAALVKQLAPSFSELAIGFEGLSANRVGIILQGFPLTGQIQLLRQQFHQLLHQHQLLQGLERQQPRLNAHASLVVYGTPHLADKEALVTYIDQHRFTNYGRMTTNCIDIVRYEREADQVRIITLDQITLKAS